MKTMFSKKHENFSVGGAKKQNYTTTSTTNGTFQLHTTT